MPFRSLLTAVVALVLVVPCSAAKRGPIKKLSYDPGAPVVELFDAAFSGDLGVKIITKDARDSNVFVENKTDTTLTVVLPKTIAAVHVLKQFQQPGLGPIGVAPSLDGSLPGGGQSITGQFQPTGNSPFPLGNNQNQFFDGANFFSIPPERSVWLKLESVCLDHGAPTPTPRMTYVVVPTEVRVEDPVLRRVVSDFNRESDDYDALQAAAWHLSSGKSWLELRRMTRQRAGVARPYFTSQEIEEAKAMVERARNATDEPTGPVRRGRVAN